MTNVHILRSGMKQLRKTLKKSRKEFAHLLGISVAALSHWETDISPDASKLFLLSYEVGLSPSIFFPGIDVFDPNAIKEAKVFIEKERIYVRKLGEIRDYLDLTQKEKVIFDKRIAVYSSQKKTLQEVACLLGVSRQEVKRVEQILLSKISINN